MHKSIVDVYHNYQWHFNKLVISVPAELITNILSTPIAQESGVEDHSVWSGHVVGTYSTSSGYSWLLHKFDGVLIDQNWMWVGKYKASEKIRFLMWLICHDAMPTVAICLRRHLGVGARCPRSGKGMEDPAHCTACTFVSSLGVFCNVLPGTVLRLSHSTTLRNCYYYLSGPLLTATSTVFEASRTI